MRVYTGQTRSRRAIALCDRLGLGAAPTWIALAHARSRGCLGAVRVRVGSIEGDVFHVVILASSGARPGERLTYKRESLYAAESDGRRMFEELIAFL